MTERGECHWCGEPLEVDENEEFCSFPGCLAANDGKPETLLRWFSAIIWGLADGGWETSAGTPINPDTDEMLEIIDAALAAGVCTEDEAEHARKEVDSYRKDFLGEG